MADVHSKETRSYNMSRIKGKNTKPEMMVREYLHGKGFRYRLHVKQLPGKPDIVLPKHRTIVMVHGCFWHGHEGCRLFVVPKTRTDWWMSKINRNKEVDQRNNQQLQELGWKVLTVYECELKKGKVEDTLSDLEKNIRSDN